MNRSVAGTALLDRLRCLSMPPDKPPAEIADKVWVDSHTGCWLWLGKPHPTTNRGRWRHKGVTDYAHRRVWQVFVGEISDGYDVGHKCHDEDPDCPGGLCDHRLCVNYVEHLALMTRQENVLKGKTIARTNTNKQFCPQDHEYTMENTLWTGKKKRQRKCKICVYKRNREAARKRRQAALPKHSPR